MIDAENYALEEEQKQIQWENRFAKREEADYTRLNELLEQQDYGEILRLYTEEDYGGFYSGRNAFVSMNLAVKILRQEKDLENHVLWDVKSITELDEKLRKMRFLIWRVEYFGCEEVEKELLAYVMEYRPSDWMLKYLISATSLQEKKVMLGFAGLFLKWNMPAYAESFVSYLEKR